MSYEKYERINEYIKEFLKFNNYQSTLECLEAEERMMKVTSKDKRSIKVPNDDLNTTPKLYRMFEGEGGAREKKFESDMKRLQNKHQGVL